LMAGAAKMIPPAAMRMNAITTSLFMVPPAAD
jgi:hypothetical protein